MKEKLFYYLCFYIAGYIISLINTGIPSAFYLFPVKIIAIAFSLIAGNASYFVLVQKKTIAEAGIITIKYILIALALLFIFGIIKTTLLGIGIDITPIIGI